MTEARKIRLWMVPFWLLGFALILAASRHYGLTSEVVVALVLFFFGFVCLVTAWKLRALTKTR
jgi:lipopolysaccharide export LptBFGC system permease protein LptF